MKVGVIGLGSMGMGAALNLHRKGHEVTGCEPRETARVEFAAAQGRSVASADQLPADLDAVVVFVINAAQTDDVLFGPHGCLSKLNTGAVVLCCSTVSPDQSRNKSIRLDMSTRAKASGQGTPSKSSTGSTPRASASLGQ